MLSTLLRRTAVVFAAMLLAAGSAVMTAAPAQAAWGNQYNVELQVDGPYNQDLGYAEGWVQFDTDGDTFRYSIEVCRQSSYTPPTLSVGKNASYSGGSWSQTVLDTHKPGYQPPGNLCSGGSETFSGQFTTSNYNVLFVLEGNTFVGRDFVEYDDYRQVYNPY
ncbi:hypothetical protein [Glycomyces xiaoerkulensis]|uniref:hypothetical protein n=1 Tax=Glycomyces xiaoerkulensis TaxID=2038139 RepID=UPI000C26BA6F|nr:hypothetical protein [Glycomyces xiaoerkulensis]